MPFDRPPSNSRRRASLLSGGKGALLFAVGVGAIGVSLAACDRAVPLAAAPGSAAPPASATFIATAASASQATPSGGAPSPGRAVPLLTAADVDARLAAEWDRAGVAPAAPASDPAWLRRLWVDAAGTIPPAERVRVFLADPSPDKRARAIDEVVASPLWAEHWAAYWDGVWMGRETRGAQDVDRGAFRTWLHGEFARGAPWSDIVTGLLTATGRNSAGGSRRDANAMTAVAPTDGTAAPSDEGGEIHGAVNWTLRYKDTPQDLAGAASRTLLGVQIQCAQCHDHKTEAWTQKDFQRFAAAFTRTRPEPVERGKNGKTPGAIRRVDLVDLDHPAPRFAKTMTDFAAIAGAHPTALDGTDLGGGTGVRVAVARWVTSPGNPWFARAFVNRMWGHFLGRGFVDPVDDLRVSNPPAAPSLLDALSADFVASGYDVQHLVRVITGTRAYATSATPLSAATATADPEAKLWERFRMTPLGSDELWNALVAATRLDGIVQASLRGPGRAGRLDLGALRARVRQRYDFLFDVDEESDASDYDGTIAQGLALLNGSVVATGATTRPGGALAEILAMPGDDAAKIEALYLRTLSRLPDEGEVARWTAYVRGSGSRQRAFEDLLWALLNSSEFVFNH